MTNKQVATRSKALKLLVKRKALLLNLDLCGMRHQAITMMLPLVSTMIQIQVCALWGNGDH